MCWLILFRQLDGPPVQLWDESRQVLNALEMSESGEWRYTTYQGKPDMWNTKPHLLIVLQAMGFRLLGPGELALRLPSAIAAFALVLLVFHAVSNMFQSWFPGMAAALLLLASPGFTAEHMARSGDYDSLLMLFVFAASWQLWQLLQGKGGRTAGYFWLFVFLAVMTKGVAALLWAPGWLLSALLLGKLPSLLRSRNFLIGGFLCLLLIMSYYLLREMVNPGYLKHVWWNEFTGRYGSANEGHVQPFGYYFARIREFLFSPWWILPIAGLIAGLSSRHGETRQFALFTGLSGLVFLLILSSAETRIYWYAAPLLPILAVLSAIALRLLWLLLSDLSKLYLSSSAPVALILLLLFAFPALIQRTEELDHHWLHPQWPDHVALALQRQERGSEKWPDNLLLADAGYSPVVEYYNRRLKAKGRPIPVISVSRMQPGMKVALHRQEQKDSVMKMFETIHYSGPDRLSCYELVATK